MEWVDAQLGEHPDGDILWIDFEPHQHPHWRYHAALVLDGIVYDAWFPNLGLSPKEHVRQVFGSDVLWEINPGQNEDEEPCNKRVA